MKQVGTFLRVGLFACALLVPSLPVAHAASGIREVSTAPQEVERPAPWGFLGLVGLLGLLGRLRD